MGLSWSALVGCQGVAKSIEGLFEPDRDAPEPVADPTDEGAEPTTPDGEAELPERPPTSIVHSATEVVTFKNIIDDPELSREERIQALLKLGPAALQNPSSDGAPGASASPASEPEVSPPRSEEPSDWELAAARRRVNVVMYSTAWCGVCKRAKRYFDRERISVTEHDVDQDPRARAEYLALNPRRSVPTIRIGQEVIVGFSERSVEDALDRAARARLN